jgi:RND family efflux transporter MFP subunit
MNLRSATLPAFMLVAGLTLISVPLLRAQDRGAAASAKAQAKADPSARPSRPALSVVIARPESTRLPLSLSANGSVAPWQEAILGAEVNGLRLAEVRASVGDQVRRGQVLAVFAREAVQVDIAQARAALAEAQANAADARANAERATQVAGSGVLSAQQVAQYQTAEKTALARVAAMKAQLDAQQLRLRHTQVVASDDGVISSRSATLGAVVPQGQELFRLIRQNRLEWRGEVPSADLARLSVGLPVRVRAGGTAFADGRIRVIGPTVDAQSRNALVYVDLPEAAARGLRPGTFAAGEFVLGATDGLTLPQEAVALRDGFSYAYRVGELQGDQARISQVKLQLGRRLGNRVEILDGLKAGEPVVASGASFLADGDIVKVVPK